MTPPASTEPMYLNITEGELDRLEQLGTVECGDTEARDIGDVVRARGPVAQQAPAQRYFPIASCYECANRMRMHELYKPYGMMILPEGKESTDFMGRWVCTEKDDQEIIGDEIPSWCPLSKGISSPDHGAALIAQEREKWERERAQDTLAELDTTIWMLYEFCEWFCGRDCEETPCMITVSRLHERLPGIQKQMKEHPEYLEKWNVKRAEQKSLRSEVGK